MTNNETTDDESFPRTIGKVATRSLTNAGYARLADLRAASERELLAIHGVGPKAIRILRETLAERGWSFKD